MKLKLLFNFLTKNSFLKEAMILKESYLTNDMVLVKNIIEDAKSENQNYSRGEDVANADIFRFFQWLERNDHLNQNDINNDYFDIDPNNYKDYYEEYYKSNYWEKMNTTDLPPWTIMSFNRIVKDEWLVHFTDHAYSIAEEGFIYGAPDPSRIAYTRHESDSERQAGSGYNFAFLAKDSRNLTGDKYGKEAVLFKANGILVTHYGDNEEQVIFLGSTARDIIPLVKDRWDDYIKIGNLDIKKFSTFKEAVKWTTANFNQYRKAILGE